jgi:TolB-like protein
MSPTADEVRLQLDRLLASDALANSDRLCRFLRYVVERTLAGEADRLKEYAIGVDVFDRDERYDPRLDSIVRVEAGRLRTKIEAYYNGHGREDAVVIWLRRGSYVPTFERREAIATAERPEAAAVSGAPRRTRRRGLWLAVAGAGVLAASLAVWRVTPGSDGERPTSQLTIAVLPFAQYSTDPASALLAARVTDGVSSELVRLGTLAVVSRTSTVQAAAGSKSLREVARTLGADVVMEASLVAEGGRVRVEARLVDAARDRKFWVGSFTGDRATLTELQRRIAAATAEAALTRRPR